MKKFFGFGWKKKGQPPSGSASLPCPPGAYDIQYKELSKLHRAAASGDLAQVRRRLKKFSIDGRDEEARTPLHLACANGHVAVVTHLVESKCKLNLLDSDNRSPLMKAVQCQQEKCVAILLEHGAEPNLADSDGNTALHLSVISPNTTVAELLLDYDANIEAQNKEGFSPLALAISEHQEEIAEFLLGHGANVHARDQRERTPLMIAASDGELNLVKVLLRYGADVSHTDPHEWTAEDYAVIHGYSSLSELLAQHADSENTAEASAAAATGLPVLSIPPWAGTADVMLGAPAVDRAIDDSSQGDSISSEKEEGDDNWHTSEEEELYFTPKKLQKPNLTLLMNAAQKFRKKNDDDSSRNESPKSPKKSLKEEQEEEDQEDEETQSKDIQGESTECEEKEEEQEKEDTGEKLQTAVIEGVKNSICNDNHQVHNASKENAGALPAEGAEEEEDNDSPWDSEVIESDCEGMRQVSSGVFLPAADRQGIYSKILSEECNNGFSEKPSNSQLKTPESALEMKETSPKKRQQESGALPAEGAEEEEDNDSPWDSEVIESDCEGMRQVSSGVFLPAADRQGIYSKILSEECNNGFSEKPSNSQLKTPESALEMKETSPKKRQQESGALPAKGAEEEEDNDSPWDSEVIESDCEGMRQVSSGVFLPAADRQGIYSKILSEECNNGFSEKPSNSQLKTPESALEMKETSPKKRQQESGALPAEGAEEEEDNDSPWDSEVIESDCEGMRQVSSGVFLPAADRQGIYSKILSEECNNGFSEKPSNSQLKTPESALEMKETSPKKRQQESGEHSGSTCRMSSAAEKEDIKDALENDEMPVEKEKSKLRCFKTEVMAKQEDLDKLNPPPGNITDQPMKQKVTLRKKDSSKIETGNTAEVKDEKNFSSEEGSRCIKMPMKGKLSPNAKASKKNKRQASKKKADQQMSSSTGNHFQVLDDSTFSETSQDERRPAAKLGSEKNKVSTQMDVTADPDLARSSDTTSADAELPTSTYKEATLLLEQLHVDHTDSAILLKLQNILLEYERIIEHEKNRYLAVWREVRKLESEKESSQLRAEETQEWKNDIQSLKCTLKQEEEKRLRVETLYEKTSETLRKKEDQYCKEMEEKQQLELRSRNLEMELITLRKLLKQVEEERDETRRQLSQEKSARALQEEILNHHLWRQKELEEEARTIEKSAAESDMEREKALMYKNQLLQDEITRLRVELDQVRLRHQEEEGKYLEENETLKEKNEDLKKQLRLNEEALAQTVFQYNGQLSLLKTESAVLNSKLEQTKESKDRLETEIESFRSRLNTTVQELERHQSSKSDAERMFQRERDEWLCMQDRLHRDLSDVRETNKSLSQQLSKAESKANSLENELHQLKQTLREKTLLLEMTQKELSQAQSQAKECDHARQLEKDQVSKFIIKQESLQERLAHLQSENLLLRQQLEDMQNKGILKEKVVNDVQDRFNDIFNKFRADTEKQVYLVEERNKELNAKCTDLREQVFKYETDKVEREGMIRQLQQELADAFKKQSMSEASLEVTARYRSDLEEDKLRLQKELEKVKTKLWELEEEHLQSDHRVHGLKIALENKEKEVQGFLLASSEANTAIKKLEEHVQRLEMENAKLEATLQQQGNKIEALQQDQQTSASIDNRLEELITSLRTTQAAAEDHHHQQVAELSQQLKAQSKKCEELEAENQDLREELSTMHENHQKLETSKCQLIEEVANLKHRLETSMVDHNHIEQYKKEVEERAEQEIRQKLQQVNLFLQVQAASQDRLEQIRASHHASLRKQLKHRIRDLEFELDRIKNIQQDNIFQKESTQAEVKRYKELYLEEVKIRRCLANKLERANEKLAEASTHLLQECHRNKSLTTSSIVSGGVAPSPFLYPTELGHLGNNLALNGNLSLGGSFLTLAGSTLSSRNRVEAYVTKVRQELDERITKEIEQATAEHDTGPTGASPMGSTDRSSKNVHVDQEPLSRAIQEYHDVLTKNYMIY
ncbi:ankyrin repeat domain-containing protein 26 isoform B [Columba livia]|nr:ankyrin repeat domain-containing protein 26 isoform B [Columba livia]